jgi:hypothetical protein
MGELPSDDVIAIATKINQTEPTNETTFGGRTILRHKSFEVTKLARGFGGERNIRQRFRRNKIWRVSRIFFMGKHGPPQRKLLSAVSAFFHYVVSTTYSSKYNK